MSSQSHTVPDQYKSDSDIASQASSRQENEQSPNPQGPTSQRYIDENRYNQDAATTIPVYPTQPFVQSTSVPTVPTTGFSLGSGISVPSYSLQYQNNPTISSSTAYPSGSYNYHNNQYPPAGPAESQPHPSPTSVISPVRTNFHRTALPRSSSASSAREYYGTTNPGRRHRYPDPSRSPSNPAFSRNMADSDSPGSVGSPGSNEGVPNAEGNINGPPFRPIDVNYTLLTSQHQVVRPNLKAKYEKGFFYTEGAWTCYRRNYFGISCSYTLNPYPAGPVYLQGANGNILENQVHGFAIGISAVVDGPGGKSVDLVQHTAKRDKGPQTKPERLSLSPERPEPGHAYGGHPFPSVYDNGSGYVQSGHPPVDGSFDRIQFKTATANNGKRRAAQQYFHLILELWADLGSHRAPHDRWIKVASRMSDQAVVRGRSPGHYAIERRGSDGGPGRDGNQGPYGSGGSSGGGSSSSGSHGGNLGSNGPVRSFPRGPYNSGMGAPPGSYIHSGYNHQYPDQRNTGHLVIPSSPVDDEYINHGLLPAPLHSPVHFGGYIHPTQVQSTMYVSADEYNNNRGVTTLPSMGYNDLPNLRNRSEYQGNVVDQSQLRSLNNCYDGFTQNKRRYDGQGLGGAGIGDPRTSYPGMFNPDMNLG